MKDIEHTEKLRMMSLEIALRLYETRRPRENPSWTEEEDRTLLEACFRDAHALACFTLEESHGVLH